MGRAARFPICDLDDDIQNGENGKWIAWNNVDPPDGFDTGTADNLELVTKREYDCLCRHRLAIDTGGALHYTAYEDDRVSRFPYWDTSNDESALPFEVRRSTYQHEDLFTVDPAQVDVYTQVSPDEPVGIDVDTVSTSTYQRWTRRVKDDVTGVVESAERYIDIGNSKALMTTYKYTAEGYRYYEKAPDGTIRYTKFDEIGRRIESWMGTDDTGGSYSDPDGSGNDMKLVTETFYDDGDAMTRLKVGNGNVTKTIAHASDTQSYTTESKHDWRDQLEQTRGEDDLAMRYTRDFMGRVTKTEVYFDEDTDWTIDDGMDYELRSQTEREYDERGNVFREIIYKVDDDSPSDNDKLRSNYW